MSAHPAVGGHAPSRWSEVGKLGAFLRRDVTVLLSYRTALLSDWLSLGVQIAIFAFVSRMVDPPTMPVYGGQRASYIAFVAVGIAVAAFMQVGLNRVMTAIRSEQLMGTLECLLLTPTSMGVVQLGSAAYEMLYVPLRTALFLVAVSAIFDLEYQLSSLLPAMTLVAVFLPFIWGIGIIGASLVLTFKRGSGMIGLFAMALGASSGAYFPVDLLPGWAQAVMRVNPLTITLEGARECLVGGLGWAAVPGRLVILAPMSLLALAVGLGAFRLALRKELRRGTLGQY